MDGYNQSGRWKNTYSRWHWGHFITTDSSPSPWTAILVPQKSHLLQSSSPRNQGSLPLCGFPDSLPGSSSLSEEPVGRESALGLPIKLSRPFAQITWFCFMSQNRQEVKKKLQSPQPAPILRVLTLSLKIQTMEI
jgi:hypothetical protein